MQKVMKLIWRFVWARLREPSSKAAISGILLALGLTVEEAEAVLTLLGALFGAWAVFTPERGEPSSAAAARQR